MFNRLSLFAFTCCIMLGISGCGGKGHHTSFSTKDLMSWGINAKTTPCDELWRQWKTIRVFYSNRYDTKGQNKALLTSLAKASETLIVAEKPRCPNVGRSAGQQLLGMNR